MKAFLSHSSRDKEIVRAVAKELGRQFCVLDEQSFETGEDFKASIERAFDESSIFVLFASQNSLDSLWVKFETEEAWYRKLRNVLTKSIVYLIDSAVEPRMLPEWLQRALFRRQIVAKAIARDIRHHLDELLRERQHVHFIGRSHKVEELEQSLTPIDGSEPPHAVFISGLPGIGRRSLIRRTSPSILNLRKFIEIRVGESDSINDICISVADRAEPYSTISGLKRMVQNIKKLSDAESLNRTLDNLRSLVEAGELPIFLDEGGLLDSDGYVREPINGILKEITPNDDAYVFFVSDRRPSNSIAVSIPVVQLSPLQTNETKRLISLLAQEAGLIMSPEQVGELTEYIAGYPPSAYFAIQQAKDYGVDLLIQDKTRLVEFQASVFLKHLSTLTLDSDQKDILCLLASYSPLPLQVIAKLFPIELEKLTDVIMRLIDLALVITTDQGYYRIADPIAHAAARAFGFPTEDQYKNLAKLLYDYLEKSETDAPLLDLSRVLFRAALWAKDMVTAGKAIHLSNDLIRITETHYHARKYRDAIAFGYAAIKERPESITPRMYLIRALIQEEKYPEAETQIDKLKKYAPLREVYFLKGFLERRRNRFSSAIASYKESERLGRKGVALSRELAFCYYIVGEQEEAIKYIEEALKRHGDNPYIVDLWAQIATQRKDENTARKALDRLELINKSLFYYHRLSRVELVFGNLPGALEAARTAVNFDDTPPFEVISQLILCEIESGNLPEADELLQRLDRDYGHIRRDIRLALRCRLENNHGNYGNALTLSEQINDKTTVFWKKIRRDALSGELQASALKDSVRATYEEELSSLETELKDILTEQFAPSELDIHSLY